MKIKIISTLAALAILLAASLTMTGLTGCATSQPPTTQQVLSGFQTADAGFTTALVAYEVGLDVLWTDGKITPSAYEVNQNDVAIALQNLYAFRQAYTEALLSNDSGPQKAEVDLIIALGLVATDLDVAKKNPVGVGPGGPPPVSLPTITPVGTTMPSHQ
jgi:hypothetical protein